MFNREWNGFLNSFDEIFADSTYSSSKVNFYVKDDTINLVYDVSGHKKENILIEIEDDVLIVKSKLEKTDQEMFGEISWKRFDIKDINIPVRISSKFDLDTVKTDYQNGLLIITIEKSNKKRTLQLN
jgi:HSP20 family molecular chaperone IbpA